MIDFSKIFDDDGAPSEEDLRNERLARDDRNLFEGKRIHQVDATMSMARAGGRDIDAQIYRATRPGPDGKAEAIGLVFKGQRLEDLKNGTLMAEMETERQEKISSGDYSDPTRDIQMTGAWKARSWKDADGKQHKAFDLVVATWSFINEAGVRVNEDAETTVAAPTRQDERNAAVQAKARDRAQARTPRPAREQGPHEL